MSNITFPKTVKVKFVQSLSAAIGATEQVKHSTTEAVDLLESRGVDSSMVTGKQPEHLKHVKETIDAMIYAALDARTPGVMALVTMPKDAAKDKLVGGYDRLYWQQQRGSYAGKLKRELESRETQRAEQADKGDGDGESKAPSPGATDEARCLKEILSTIKRLKKMKKERNEPRIIKALNLANDLAKALAE